MSNKSTTYGWIGQNIPTQGTTNEGIFSVTEINQLTNDVSWNVTPFNVEYLVIAGGGSGGFSFGTNVSRGSAGGGAGGYRTNYASENTGGGLSGEADLEISTKVSYSVTVGAGGPTHDIGRTQGNDSSFHTITSAGGGLGRAANQGVIASTNGGSGGGVGYDQSTRSSGTIGQGFGGGYGWTNGSQFTSGSGGGAAAAGVDATNQYGKPGGNGVQSSITGVATYRGGGGASASSGVTNYTSMGLGGLGGGGGTTFGDNGDPNTGGGGGACGNNLSGGGGGSGVVILRYPNTFTINVGAGLTASAGEQTDGSDKYIEITAGTGTVSWS